MRSADSIAPAGSRKYTITPSPSHFTGTPPCSRTDRPTSTARAWASEAAAASPEASTGPSNRAW
jgi:hypothetical protein